MSHHRRAGLSFEYGSAGERSFTVGSQAGAYIETCMQAAGYRPDVSSDLCQSTRFMVLRENPYCYTPASRISSWLLRAELSIFGK
jgi:hypothetical protein